MYLEPTIFVLQGTGFWVLESINFYGLKYWLKSCLFCTDLGLADFNRYGTIFISLSEDVYIKGKLIKYSKTESVQEPAPVHEFD